MKTHYLSCAETAKLVRAALKKTFSGVKFSVKSHVYSGGASINVTWTDGPAPCLVDTVTGQFAAGRFDGSIDLAYSVNHWLMPDGTITLASDQGTQGNGGAHPAAREWMPNPEAKLVHFGANSVFTRRLVSPALMGRVINRLAHRGYPVEALLISVSNYDGSAHARQLTYDPEVTRGFDMEREVWQAVARTHCAA